MKHISDTNLQPSSNYELISADSSLLTGNSTASNVDKNVSSIHEFRDNENASQRVLCLNFGKTKAFICFRLKTLYKYFKGSMPLEQAFVLKHGILLEFIDNCLRGISQIFFVNNPVSGVIILVAIGIDTWYNAVFAIVGVAASTLMASIVCADVNAIRSGIFGYNGSLTALAIAYFSFGDKNDPKLQMLLPAVIMGALSTMILIGVIIFTKRLLGTPPFTFPFQAASWLWLLAAQSTYQYFPLRFPNPTLAVLAEDMSAAVVPHNYAVERVIHGIFAGISQVCFVNNAVSGGIMLLGLAVSSPILAFMALFGSCFGAFFNMAMGSPSYPLFDGLYGYNPPLTAIAIGCMFFVPTLKNFLYTNAALMMTMVLNAAVSAALTPIGMPPFTFPFTLTSWIFVMVGANNNIPGVITVSLPMVTNPENHRYRFVVIKDLSLRLVQTFGNFKIMTLHNEKDLDRIEAQMLPVLLCQYAACGDLFNLQSILCRCPEASNYVNATAYCGRTLLMVAAANKHLCVVNFLLEEGADVNVVDQMQRTALDEAISSGDPNIVNLIASNGGALGSFSHERMMCAVSRNDEFFLALMLKAKMSPLCMDSILRTPLHLAAALPNALAVITTLLIHGADADLKDAHGQSALDIATIANHHDYVTLFANNKEMNNSEKLASCSALDSSQTSLPISHIQASDKTISLSLMICLTAAFNHTTDLAQLLTNESQHVTDMGISGKKRNYVDVNSIRDYDRRGPLCVAATSGNIDACRLLLSMGADANGTDRWDTTPLWNAVLYGNLETVKLLITFGAVMPGNSELVFELMHKLVLENKTSSWQRLFAVPNFDLNIVNYDCMTAMHLAAKCEAHESVIALRIAGARTDVKDRWGQTPSCYSSKKSIQLALSRKLEC